MKSFIVIGVGRFGDALARELFKDGHEVLVIDRDEEKIQKIANAVTHAVIANASDNDVLESLGVRNFDCAIVSIAGDIQDSILATLYLKEQGVNYVIAKARDKIHSKVLSKIGADKVVFPEHEMGERLAQVITMKNVLDYLELSEDYSIMEIKCPKPWHNKTLVDLDIRAKFGVTVIAIRDSQTDVLSISLKPDLKLNPQDILIILGANSDIEEINEL